MPAIFRNTQNANILLFTLDNTHVTGIPDIGLNSYPTFAELDNYSRKDMTAGEYNENFTYYKNLFAQVTDVSDYTSKTLPETFA
jgi:hypothetical protein